MFQCLWHQAYLKGESRWLPRQPDFLITSFSSNCLGWEPHPWSFWSLISNAFNVIWIHGQWLCNLFPAVSCSLMCRPIALSSLHGSILHGELGSKQLQLVQSFLAALQLKVSSHPSPIVSEECASKFARISCFQCSPRPKISNIWKWSHGAGAKGQTMQNVIAPTHLSRSCAFLVLPIFCSPSLFIALNFPRNVACFPTLASSTTETVNSLSNFYDPATLHCFIFCVRSSTLIIHYFIVGGSHLTITV